MGNKLVPIVIGVIVLIGAVIGLGMAGVVKIPGLTPAPVKSKSAKAKEAKAAAKKEADEAEAAKVAKQKADDDFTQVLASRDQLVKASKWQDALPLAQQAVDTLAKDKKASPELEAATTVLNQVQTELEKAAAPKPDLDKGYAKLAAVWGEMEPDKIAGILKEGKYKPEDAAPILKKMDEDKVAAVLAAMKLPKDQAAYSNALAAESSKPVVAPATSG